jgi:single-strand DNA-binding protein
MNSVNLMGRLTADPDLKSTQTGIEVCSFMIAINRQVAKDKEKVADFIPCTAWDKTGAFISTYFKKGDMIAISGSLQSRRYEKDGKNHTAYDVRVDRAYFCGGKKQDGAQPIGTDKPNFVELPDGEELPF